MDPFLMLVDLLINLYVVVLIARIFLPMFGVNPYHPVMQVIYQLTEPVLAPIRSILPRAGMLDFSPMVVVILLSVLQAVLNMLLS